MSTNFGVWTGLAWFPVLPQRGELRQLDGIVRLELARLRADRRRVAIILLALVPLLFPIARIVQIAFSGNGFFQASYRMLGEVVDPARVAVSVAGTFHVLVIRSLAFFLILYVFGSILRGDMTDRVLHLYFQTPVRRSLIVAGKYIAAVLTVFGALSCTTVLLYALSFLPFGGRALASAAIEQGQGAALLRDIGVLLLACLSYGAMFLLLGAIFRNPSPPGMLFFLWEMVTTVLPVQFKAFSLAYYVSSLLPPLNVPNQPFAIVSDPARPLAAIVVLLAASAVFLDIASRITGRMQIDYTKE